MPRGWVSMKVTTTATSPASSRLPESRASLQLLGRPVGRQSRHDRAGRDRADPDAVLEHLPANGLGKAVDRPLGGRVNRLPGIGTCAASELVTMMSPLRRAIMCGSTTCTFFIHDVHVEVQHAADRCRVVGDQVATNIRTRISVQDVDSASQIQHAWHQARAGLRVEHIDAQMESQRRGPRSPRARRPLAWPRNLPDRCPTPRPCRRRPCLPILLSCVSALDGRRAPYRSDRSDRHDRRCPRPGPYRRDPSRYFAALPTVSALPAQDEAPGSTHPGRPAACRSDSASQPQTRPPRRQPHCPTYPQAVQNSQPSRWITAGLPHSGQRVPSMARGADGFCGDSSTPMSRSGKPCSSSTPSIA